MNSKRLYLFNLIVKILPPSRCHGLKSRLLRWCGATVGENVEIFQPVIHGDFDLIIGNNVFLGFECMIFGPKGSTIRIDDYGKISSRTMVVTGDHKYGVEYESIAGPGIHKDIHVKKGATIGATALLVPGVTVGEKSHVAAGAIVTHDVPPHVRVAGIPAKIIHNFDEDKKV